MPTTYKQLYDSVYSKISSFEFAEMNEEEADGMLSEYLRPAAAMFERCKQDLNDRDDDEQTFNITLSDTNFEILANFMVICYLDAVYIRNPLMLKAHMSSTDFHKFDNKDVLSKVIELRDMYKKENRRLMINSSLRGGRLSKIMSGGKK